MNVFLNLISSCAINYLIYTWAVICLLPKHQWDLWVQPDITISRETPRIYLISKYGHNMYLLQYNSVILLKMVICKYDGEKHRLFKICVYRHVRGVFLHKLISGHSFRSLWLLRYKRFTSHPYVVLLFFANARILTTYANDCKQFSFQKT